MGLLASAGIPDRPQARSKNNLLSIPFMFVTADLAIILQYLVADPREQAGPIVVIVRSRRATSAVICPLLVAAPFPDRARLDRVLPQ